MKTNKLTQAKHAAEPAAQQGQGAGAIQRQLAATPRQAGEAAHIAQLKGEAKPKGKMPPPKKGKGK
jgi:lipopolysaccharide biosynthesis protein